MAISLGSSFSSIGRRNIGIANNSLADNFAKLSSGRKINKAADNAAALAISEQLIADIRSAGQAQQNISDGRALTRVAEGAMGEISSLMARGRELSIQSANGTLNDSQRATLQIEIDSITQEIDRIRGVTEFNGQKLLDGSLSSSAAAVNVQAGIQNTANDRISLNVVEDSSSSALGVDTVDISTQAGAQDALAKFDSAIDQVNSNRASIGALQNRFDNAANNLSVSRENLISANSSMRDLDYAEETSLAARNQILQSAAISALGQGMETQRGLIGSLMNIRG